MVDFGGSFESAVDLNNHGDAVGWGDSPHGFLWHAGGATELLPLGGDVSYAAAINDSGVVVGYSDTGVGFDTHATEWLNGGPPIDIDPFGSSFSFGSDVANSGEIVGATTLLAGGWRPFTLVGGTATQLGTLGGNYAAAQAVNDVGVVVGWSYLAGGFDAHPWVDSGSGMTELALDGPLLYGDAADLNGSGTIVGSRILAGQPPNTIAYVWQSGVTTLLPPPPGYDASAAFGVNDAGHVVGTLIAGGSSVGGFYWDGVQLHNLDDLLPPGSGWTVVGGSQINEAGQIVGTGEIGGETHGFILTPSGATLLGPGTVTPVDAATGASPVTVSYADVTGAGATTLEITSSGPTPPAGFELGTPPTYYELSTTATFSGSVQVCIDYTGIDFGGATPSLWHYEGGVWTDVTTTNDPVNQIVCGSVTSLSPFALFRQVQVAYQVCPLFDAAQPAHGAVVPVRLRLCDSAGTNLSSPELVLTAVQLVQPGGTSVTPTAAGNANPGNVFRYDAALAGYVYNLSAKGLEPGVYTLGFVVGDDPTVYTVQLTVG